MLLHCKQQRRKGNEISLREVHILRSIIPYMFTERVYKERKSFSNALCCEDV
jgi:hypothetical protein